MKDIEILGLFGRLNYKIKCHENDIIIITGPNGYGKTTLLKIIKSVYSNNYDMFAGLNFKLITINFQNGSTLKIKKENDNVNVKIIGEGKEYLVDFSQDMYLEAKDRGSEELEFIKNGKKIRFNLNVDARTKSKIFSIPDDMHNEFLGGVQCRFIKAQRLYDETSKEVKITDFSNDLVNQIKNVSLEAAKISQVLDSSFPSRLFSNLTDDTIQISSESIADRLYGLELLKRNYIKYNLIESDDMFGSLGYLNEKISLNSRDILDLYINDALDKLAPYEPLYEKIDLFFNLIKSKNFAFKKLEISKTKGFFFTDENKMDIPLSELSSGEQNQVNLYYNMIFGINSSSVILIDEPEISLHVGWQKEFIESIEKIQKINKVSNVFIATHSPQIINNRWDDAYFDLFEMSELGI